MPELQMQGRLSNKVALVTGAGRGIGQAIALKFAEEGAHVVVNDLDSTTGHETVALITQQGGTAQFIQADVSDEASVQRMVDRVISTAENLDILVNNAGIATALDNYITQTNVAIWDNIMSVNLRAVYLCCKYAIPYLAKRTGVIINLGSIVGLAASRLVPTTVYTPAKAGVIALTKQIAVDYGPQNIRANVICPGLIDSAMLRSVVTEDQIRDRYLSRIPLARLGKPQDVANLAAFLACEDAAYISGAVVVIDGGMTA